MTWKTSTNQPVVKQAEKVRERREFTSAGVSASPPPPVSWVCGGTKVAAVRNSSRFERLWGLCFTMGSPGVAHGAFCFESCRTAAELARLVGSGE